MKDHPAPVGGPQVLPVRSATWAAPANVGTLFTTRRGGESTGPWGDREGGNGLNLGPNCGDVPDRVQANRRRLAAQVGQPVRWLHQVHGARVIEATAASGDAAPESADAHFCTRPGVALAVLVADCLPVVLADRAGTVVGAAHAGWRGLAAGVLENTVGAMRARAGGSELLACLGPCIGESAFEVGDEVVEAFVHDDTGAGSLFRPGIEPGKWWADLAGLAVRRLDRMGVTSVTRAGGCTVTDRENYWSYRRDGACGRMAAVIWLRDDV